MLIYAIRHGQTDWNAEYRLQGQKDIPLNEIGRGQARGNGERLGEILGEEARLYDFVSSPLLRTRETMERARAAMGLTPELYRTDDRLKELSFGDWEGRTLKEVEGFSPALLHEREKDKWAFVPPGADAESYEILSWRVGAWLKDVVGPTVCVCHGGVIRSFFRIVGGVSTAEAAELPIPQDAALRIDPAAGAIGWIE
ncbi:histidine phosphatase family protein [Martelella lutilitoris]|uniref:Histidine phosphatase family protein n=1 Tax=Martelella lutilitoris TaxID=2583532 RepID=A0A5C4JR15_9HYPH|nr:histidine phosphatase family protein [Martelella lutilitoris]TNB47846.1 histidine phosphatase family protein [Martelella lutilitoris]